MAYAIIGGLFVATFARSTSSPAVTTWGKFARSGKQANVVAAAIARELAGFVWAIARRVPLATG